jgi:phosphoribosylamine--glycine ligase/phosphoribosylformylglycinamidine cyclo-ligase
MAWKVSQSPRVKKIYCMPGNSGTAQVAENLNGISVDDYPALIRLCREKQIELVMVGPEAPLANGIADALLEAGIRCFGPTKAAAEIESSKSFAKNFMARHGIPTARYEIFRDIKKALAYLEQVDHPVVIKANGLAAGKGVILPENPEQARQALEAMLLHGEFGAAGAEVVIEERISGPEVSLMAFTDGKTVVPMIPAQDHKRLLDGDRGPNTGGMGAYAPAPVCPPELIAEVTETMLLPTVSGMRLEGRPFVGVLFAGLMLTEDGPRVLEFNCRFGDPETEAVLPLLDADLAEIALACVEGRLSEVQVAWKPGSAACVVLASEGYPGKLVYGRITQGGRQKYEQGICFHAGTRQEGGKVITAGGRVFGVTAWDDTLQAAVKRAYGIVEHIHFDGMQYRKDIAARALPRSAYASSGVSIDAGNRAVELMKDAVKSTYNPAVLAGIGSFGGLFDISALSHLQNPVLVASTDGVGTKVKLAAAAGRYQGIGHDIVNHCINDILVQGARPLFFLDYFATSRLNPEITAEVVTGISAACREAGIPLLGGETAEMPGVYQPGEFDLAGTIVGVVERGRILPRPTLHAGDLLIGFRSSGPHTNGYSLIRNVFAPVSMETVYPELGIPLSDALLAPHRSYYPLIYPHLDKIKALAHLTGGGFIENIPRVLPDNLVAKVKIGSWRVPPLFELIQKIGTISTEEMYRVFNMGIGMVAIVEREFALELQQSIPEQTFLIGELIPGNRKVELA